MVKSNTHIISKLTLDVGTSPQEDAHALQSVLLKTLKEKLLPLLEHELDDLGAADQHIRIEKLTLKLPDLQAKVLEKELPRLIVAELRTEIRRLVREQGAQIKTGSDAGAVLYFLQNGRWPWWSKPIEAKAWKNELAGKQNTSLLQDLVSENLAARKRLVYLTNDQSLLRLASSFNGSQLDGQYRLLLRLRNYLPSSVSKRDARNSLFVNILQTHRINTPNFEKQLFDGVLNAWAQGTSTKNLQQHLKKQLPQIALKDQPTANWLDKMLAAKPATSDSLPIEKKEDSKPFEIVDDALYIKNAGIVLLHPYLEYLFKSQGWTRENSFTNEQCRHRAILLLQYLATSNTATDDSELALNKLLCGQPLQLPVDTGIRLSKKCLREADNLLGAVIKNWSKLKNTSPAGLRNSFLLRDGKLIQKENLDWKMQVERKTEDLLLPDLPWSFSIIRLGWMPKLLWVEW